MLPDISPVNIDVLADDSFSRQGVELAVLRIDKIHPVVSGNKLFKLRYFLSEVMNSTHRTLLTFGGAYSNHLVATAYAGQSLGFKTIGVVRGEEPALLSHTLTTCRNYGMQLYFMSRGAYSHKAEDGQLQILRDEFGEFTWVPEGGYHPLGARGAGEMLQAADTSRFTHICMALGTATSLAGCLMKALPHQTLIAVPVLKGMTDMEERLRYLTGTTPVKQPVIWPDEHWGGYAKKEEQLLRFMNDCWQRYRLPLDFVYTAKMFYAAIKHMEAGYFPRGSRLLCLHSGGLQGNLSLPPGTLDFEAG